MVLWVITASCILLEVAGARPRYVFSVQRADLDLAEGDRVDRLGEPHADTTQVVPAILFLEVLTVIRSTIATTTAQRDAMRPSDSSRVWSRPRPPWKSSRSVLRASEPRPTRTGIEGSYPIQRFEDPARRPPLDARRAGVCVDIADRTTVTGPATVAVSEVGGDDVTQSEIVTERSTSTSASEVSPLIVALSVVVDALERSASETGGGRLRGDTVRNPGWPGRRSARGIGGDGRSPETRPSRYARSVRR